MRIAAKGIQYLRYMPYHLLLYKVENVRQIICITYNYTYSGSARRSWHFSLMSLAEFAGYFPFHCIGPLYVLSRSPTTWTGWSGIWLTWKCRWLQWRKSTASLALSLRITRDLWVMESFFWYLPLAVGLKYFMSQNSSCRKLCMAFSMVIILV